MGDICIIGAILCLIGMMRIERKDRQARCANLESIVNRLIEEKIQSDKEAAILAIKFEILEKKCNIITVISEKE